MKLYNLASLKKGQIGIIEKLDFSDRKKKKHLLDMGFTKGTKVKIKKIAPMGDPVSIELRGYEICVSKSELLNIFVSLR